MLTAKRVAVTGTLASMTRAEARILVEQLEGIWVATPNRKTDYLVVGQGSWPLEEDGRLSAAFGQAERLRSQGVPLAIVSEEEFWELAGCVDQAGEVHRLYTAAQITRVLGIRRGQLRRWIRMGLIAASQTHHRLELFDYSQISALRNINELIESGVPAVRIRESLRMLKCSMPSADLSMLLTPVPDSGGMFLFRLPDGRLIDATGQLHFEFGDDDDEVVDDIPMTLAMSAKPRTVEQWIHWGLDLEEMGRFDEAADAYGEALLQGGPDPVICFNLANVLYVMDEKPRALERYRQAVELDPQYIEAWNNLGNTWADLGENDRAIAAFHQALRIDPQYADAHFNLAETLEQSAQQELAREHWLIYLRLDPRSQNAKAIRRHLGLVD